MVELDELKSDNQEEQKEKKLTTKLDSTSPIRIVSIF